jgi:FKBP-type peptidyl-prolyl cis-trans isomerase
MKKRIIGSKSWSVTGLLVATLLVMPLLAAGAPPVKTPGVAKEVKTPSGLRYVDLTVGSGAEAKPGQLVMVNYRAWLENGQEFDSSYLRREPFTFKLGASEVIAGWDEGVTGMRVGGKRKLIIPPALGYGEQGAGDRIPPNATLTFEVELLGVQR